MGRFLFWTMVFLVIGGFLLQFEVKIPFISPWLGKLPGDFVLQNSKMTIHFPVTSAALVSIFLSLIFWAFFKKKKKS